MSDQPFTSASRVDRRIDVLLDAIAETNANINRLTDLMDRHLRFDHGYGSDDDE